jgi:hypothetical protein
MSLPNNNPVSMTAERRFHHDMAAALGEAMDEWFSKATMAAVTVSNESALARIRDAASAMADDFRSGKIHDIASNLESDKILESAAPAMKASQEAVMFEMGPVANRNRDRAEALKTFCLDRANRMKSVSGSDKYCLRTESEYGAMVDQMLSSARSNRNKHFLGLLANEAANIGSQLGRISTTPEHLLQGYRQVIGEAMKA